MAHKFTVGQTVIYLPAGGKRALCKVIRHMPEENTAIDRWYRIRNDFERNVMECHLRATD